MAFHRSLSGIYKGKETRPNNYRLPQLTYADDHPGEDLPRFRFAFEVTPPLEFSPAQAGPGTSGPRAMWPAQSAVFGLGRTNLPSTAFWNFSKTPLARRQ